MSAGDSRRGPEGREGQVGREGVAGREGLPGLEGPQGPVGAEGRQGRAGSLPREVQRAFIIITIAFTVILSALGYYATENRRLGNQGAVAYKALCILKEEAEARVKFTTGFLRRNKEETILGEPRETFERRLREDRSRLRDLSILDCVPPPEMPTKEARNVS